jgi:hypothetical protein
VSPLVSASVPTGNSAQTAMQIAVLVYCAFAPWHDVMISLQ